MLSWYVYKIPRPVVQTEGLGIKFAQMSYVVLTDSITHALIWGAVAQLGERLNRTQEVGGPNPPSSTILLRPKVFTFGLRSNTVADRFYEAERESCSAE